MTQAVIAEVSAVFRIIRLVSPRAVGDHLGRWPEGALPYASTIELNRHAVGRVNRPLIPRLHPNVAWIIDPRARWQTNFVDAIEVPIVLGDESPIQIRCNSLRNGIDQKEEPVPTLR